MKIEMLDLSEIKEYARNPRKIPDAAVEAVAASIREFGFRNPCLLDRNNVLIAGHTRARAARKLGMTQVPVIRIEDLTPTQVNALRISDNKSGEYSEWDFDLLPLELQALADDEVDLTKLGFSIEELTEILAPEGNEGLTDPDDVPLPGDAAIAQAGDLWVLGNHRLLCGDSSRAEDVDRLLAGAPVHLVNTDPPYGVKVEPRSGNAIAAGLSSFPGDDLQQKKLLNKTCRMETTHRGLTHHQSFDVARQGKKHGTTEKMRPKDRPLVNDFLSAEAFDAMLVAWFGNMARVLLPGRCFYCWGGYANLANYPPVLKKCGLYFSQGIVWDKEWPVLTRKDFMGAFEICFYGWREGAGHEFFGPNNATDLWHVKKIPPPQMQHLTEKPVELARLAIEYGSRAGENVLDLFGGAGGTLIACEMTGRRAYLMELDELYCDVIVQRYEQFTGKKAERISPKETPAASAAGVEGKNT